MIVRYDQNCFRAEVEGMASDCLAVMMITLWSEACDKKAFPSCAVRHVALEMKLWRGMVHRDVKFLVLVLRSLKEVQVQEKVL